MNMDGRFCILENSFAIWKRLKEELFLKTVLFEFPNCKERAMSSVGELASPKDVDVGLHFGEI